MPQDNNSSFSRRRFLKTAGVTALAAGTGPAAIIPGRAQPKTLRIARMREFVPGYVRWFDDYAKSWGKQNDTEVIIDWIKMGDISRLIANEITDQRGHDLIHITEGSTYEDFVIDHREVYEECEHRYGKPVDFAIQSSYNPKTRQYHRFSLEYIALPVIYRKDLWDAVGKVPDSWEDIRLGGRHIKLLHDRPVGIGLSKDSDSEAAVNALLHAYGASIQNADARPALKSKQTLEALRFAKALFEEAMTEDVLSWDTTSNNRLMLSGEGSLALNGISITRAAENKKFPVEDQLAVAAIPQGPSGRLGPALGMPWMIIWKFAKNSDGAKQFLVDYIGNFRQACLASEFNFFPVFPATVPDLSALLAHDAKANPPDKYHVLANASKWTTNLGYPGFLNAAIGEIYDKRLISIMFASAATGKMTPEEAMIQADQEVRKIYDKWRALGKV